MPKTLHEQLAKYVDQYEADCKEKNIEPSVDDFAGWLFFTVEEESLDVVTEAANSCSESSVNTA